MKLVVARIQPHRLDPLHDALVDLGVTNLTAIEVKGFGEAVGHAEIHRGAAYNVAFMPMVKIEVVVEDSLVEQVVSTIRQASASSTLSSVAECGSARCCPRFPGETIPANPFVWGGRRGSLAVIRATAATSIKEAYSMEVKTERHGYTLIAKVEGRVDGANAREFQVALETAIGAGEPAVILDVEQLSYISSAGLRVILLTAKSSRNQKAKFAVCSLSEPIREVFEISGFDKIMSIHTSQAEALVALND